SSGFRNAVRARRHTGRGGDRACGASRAGRRRAARVTRFENPEGVTRFENPEGVTVGAYGDAATEIRLEDDDPRRARAVPEAISRASPPGVIECVPGYGAVLVTVAMGATLGKDESSARVS